MDCDMRPHTHTHNQAYCSIVPFALVRLISVHASPPSSVLPTSTTEEVGRVRMLTLHATHAVTTANMQLLDRARGRHRVAEGGSLLYRN